MSRQCGLTTPRLLLVDMEPDRSSPAAIEPRHPHSVGLCTLACPQLAPAVHSRTLVRLSLCEELPLLAYAGAVLQLVSTTPSLQATSSLPCACRISSCQYFTCHVEAHSTFNGQWSTQWFRQRIRPHRCLHASLGPWHQMPIIALLTHQNLFSEFFLVHVYSLQTFKSCVIV